MQPHRVLILPGWQDSGPAHWQSRWEQRHGYRRVQQDDWMWPRRGDWLARLEDELLADERPAVLVAHSLGCHLVAAWAAHTRHPLRVSAAMLVAIPDVEREDLPPQLHGWRAAVRRRLPFPALAVLSGDDPYARLGRAEGYARDWGADVVHAGDRGHLNGESGLGDWDEGHVLLRRLTATSRPVAG